MDELGDKHMIEIDLKEKLMSTDTRKLDVSPRARGARARSVREALRYSRRVLASKYPFLKEGTLQNWEDARFGGLTENGARQLAKAYQTEGLDCREEWLFYGIGPSPFESTYTIGLLNQRSQIAEPKMDYNALVTKGLELLYQYHHNTVDAIVADDGLQPGVWPGDHVAGVRYFSEDFSSILNTICIIQTQLGELLVRLLTSGSKPERYTLKCTNLETTVAQPTLTDVRIFSAAPILWISRDITFFKT